MVKSCPHAYRRKYSRAQAHGVFMIFNFCGKVWQTECSSAQQKIRLRTTGMQCADPRAAGCEDLSLPHSRDPAIRKSVPARESYPPAQPRRHRNPSHGELVRDPRRFRLAGNMKHPCLPGCRLVAFLKRRIKTKALVFGEGRLISLQNGRH